MDKRHIAIVVQGLFEKSDSIGYDAVFQYKLLAETFGANRLRLFAERFDQSRYEGIPIEPLERFWDYLDEFPMATVIYHYCDGWPEMDSYILDSDRPFIVRWHNNTPPWFYGASHRRSVERTVRGFRTIVNFIRSDNVRFWVNSNFTLEQLRALGGAAEQGAVVFPGSAFLESSTSGEKVPARRSVNAEISAENRPLRLLFVSRVVAHKGHRHVIELAAHLQKVLGRDTSATFIGRDDPSSGLKADLEHLANVHDVELLLRGEVTNEDLREAYLSADIFVCLSEHEGFGMPIFEAMRLEVPVLCWGRTALRELMQRHPFTLDELDFSKAAAAVQMLDDKAVRRDVLATQAEILKGYTSQVVADQLASALAERYGLWNAPEFQQEQGSQSSLVQALDHKLSATEHAVAVRSEVPRDFGDNYVTLYDIESYEAMLEGDRGLHRLPMQQPTADSVLFSHKEFVSPSAIRVEDGIAFSGAVKASKHHLVYGPYARFVRGYFAADFELQAELNGDPSTELELDVAAEGYGLVVARKVTAAEMRSGETIRLHFPVGQEGQIIEFRIQVSSPGNCNFIFRGVTIRNMRQSIANLPQASSSTKALLPWLRRARGSQVEATGISNLARNHFRRADELRDRAWWNDAAACYSKGLKIEPRAFEYLVQLANCLKEAGRFEESEDVYQRALALRPNDRDANLQLGRLYRQWGNLEAAYHHLLHAARFDSSAAEAMHELASTGFDISSLPDLFA